MVTSKLIKQTAIIWLAIFCLTSCLQNEDKENSVTIEGVRIPIKACVETNNRLFGKSLNTKEFCKCMIPKLYSLVKDDPEQLKFLKKGNWDEVSKSKQQEFLQYYTECLNQFSIVDSTARLNATPEMVKDMKSGMKENLIGTEMGKTNDLDKYCDCIIEGI